MMIIKKKALLIVYLMFLTGFFHASSMETYQPECSYLVKFHEHVDHGHFSLCYNEDTEQPEYTMYEFTRTEFEKLGSVNRDNKFREDKSISTGSATLDDYYDTNYDRGHLVPSGSMTYSREANSASFYMSNMSPMVPGFNRGVWAKLEAHVRDYYFKNYSDINNIIVYTIPYVNYNMAPVDVIGENEVAVPVGYFKVIYVPKMDEFKCWYLDQFDYNKAYFTFDQFEVSISEVERKTGLFFKFSKKSTFFENISEYTSVNMNVEDFINLSNELFLNLTKKDIEKNLFLFGEVYLLGHNSKSVNHNFDRDVWKGSYMEMRLSTLLKEYSVLTINQYATWGTIWTRLFKAGYDSNSIKYTTVES